MKKTRLIPLIFAAAALAFSVTACHDNIYYLIQQEVEQENGLEGDILNIVPFKGNLYISNSLIYKKTLASSGTTGKYNYQWEKVSAKCSGKDLSHIVTLAADDNYLYCYTLSIAEDVDKSVNLASHRNIYCSSDGETWTEVNISSITGLSSTEKGTYSKYPVVIFDNQIGNGSTGSSTSGRKAYVRLREAQGTTDYTDVLNTGYHVYKLNGGSAPSVESSADTSYTSPRSVKLGSTERFFNTRAVTKNANLEIAYIADGSSIYGVKDGTSGNYFDAINYNSGTIYSLAATSDYILVGTSSGLYRVEIGANGYLNTTISGFNNNAQTLLTSSVQSIYALDSSASEGNTDEYASMMIQGYLSSSPDSFKETGLYAFYPGRGHWNRDGDDRPR